MKWQPSFVSFTSAKMWTGRLQIFVSNKGVRQCIGAVNWASYKNQFVRRVVYAWCCFHLTLCPAYPMPCCTAEPVILLAFLSHLCPVAALCCPQEHQYVAILFPLIISAVGIFVCLLTTFIATDLYPAKVASEIESTLKWQLIFSTLFMTPVCVGTLV